MEAACNKLWRACISRIGSWIQGYSGATLSLTGILGLAAFLYGIYHYRLLRGPSKQDETRDADHSSTSAVVGTVVNTTEPAQTSRVQPAAVAAASSAPVYRLGSAASLTISVPGVLLEECTAEALQESATVVPQAAEILRELLAGAGKGPAVYLLANVEDDIGEAVVRGALEHAGLVGSAQGQLPPHRLLFCDTLEGKVSVVRQIEPDLHFDAQPETVRELQRFMRRLVYVAREKAPAVQGASNIQLAHSFAAYFGR